MIKPKVYNSIEPLKDPVFNRRYRTISIITARGLYFTTQTYSGNLSAKKDNGYMTAEIYMIKTTRLQRLYNLKVLTCTEASRKQRNTSDCIHSTIAPITRQRTHRKNYQRDYSVRCLCYLWSRKVNMLRVLGIVQGQICSTLKVSECGNN